MLLKMLQNRAEATDVQGIDAEKFIAACLRHRLVNVVCQRHPVQAELLPRLIRQRLAEENRKSGLQQLQNVAVLEQICVVFDTAAIGYRVIKGAPLAQMLYNDPGARMARDIDIIVHKLHFNQACAVIEQMGYSAKDLATAMHHSYINGEGIIVELHSQLSVFGMGRLSASGNRLPALNRVTIAGRNYAVLDINEYFVYLCYHGATHGWYRLLWLADIVRLLQRVNGESLKVKGCSSETSCSENDISAFSIDFTAIKRIVQKHGLVDVIGQALVLARDLLGSQPPVDFTISRRAEQLAVAAVELAIGRDCPLDDCFSFVRQPRREFRYQLQIQGSIWNKLRYLATPTVNDRRQIVLPKNMDSVYYLIRPLLLALRVWKKCS